MAYIPANLSAGTTRGSLGEIVLSNSNGLSFGINGQTITASHNGLTSQSNQAFSAQGGSSAFQTLVFTNSNGISFSNTNGSIWGSHNGLTSQSNQAFSAAGGSSAFQTLSFGDTNGVSFTNTNGSIGIASVKLSMYAVSNTTQSTSGTANHSALSFAGAGVASVGVTNGSVVISVPAGGGGLTNINVSAGTTSNNLSALTFNNANGVSFGLDGSTITASVNAGGGGGIGAGVSTGGNTAGSTGTVTTGNVVFVGSNGITLSQSTGAAGSNATITILGNPQQTVSMYPSFPSPLASSSAYSGATTTTAGGSRTSYSLYLSPMVVDQVITFNTAGFMMSHATVAGTGSLTNAHMFGIYSLNADTAMSLISTFQFGLQLSQNSVTARSHHWYWGTNSAANSSSVGGNISASIAKMNLCVLHSQATSLAEGQYWLGYMQTMSTAAAAVGSFSAYHLSLSQTTAGSLFGTNVSVFQDRFCGIISGTVSSNAAHVNIMPSSIHTSAITGTGGSSQNRWNIISLGSR